jgi:threo-3-hydroxy-L-aspartate ammonia-lyase
VHLPTFADVEAAAALLDGIALRTPIFTSRTADSLAGGRLFFKTENFQRAGAFKFRGAYNALARLDEPRRRAGVLTFSSGNHAGALALAGSLLNAPVTVVMPSDAPAVKVEATRGYGGEVILYDRSEISREELGQELAEERGLTIVPPYDSFDIVAGAGTAARELLLETGPLDYLLVPTGGGGLLAGSVLSAEALAPDCRVVGVEPEAADDASRSFRTGEIQTVRDPETVADGARTPYLGKINFEIIRKGAHDITTVDDVDLLRAMFFLWERMKIVVEPTGALAAAAAFQRRVPTEGARIGVLLSGGNLEFSKVGEWLRLIG